MFQTEREKWLYMACAIDAEGTIGLYKNKCKTYRRSLSYWWQPIIDIPNSYRKWIDMLKEKFGGSICKQRREPPKKTMHHLRISGPALLKKTLENVIPFLIIKKKQAVLLLEAISLKEACKYHPEKESPRLGEIAATISSLNRPKRS